MDSSVTNIESKTYQGFSVEIFNKYLNIDCEKGLIKWKVRVVADFESSPNPVKQCDDWNRKFANKIVGGAYNLRGKFYRRFTFFGKTLFVGKVVHLCYYGYVINNDNYTTHLDHINGNSLDDSIFNLRYVSTKTNVSLKHKTKNKNGHVGVECCNGKFRAKINVGGKTVKSRFFNTPIEAHIEYILLRTANVFVVEF